MVRLALAMLTALTTTVEADVGACAKGDTFDTTTPVYTCLVNLYPTDNEIVSLVLTEAGDSRPMRAPDG